MIRRLFERKKPSILSPLFLHFLNSSLGVTPSDEKWYIEAITHRSKKNDDQLRNCLLYTSPSPRDATLSRMPSSA